MTQDQYGQARDSGYVVSGQVEDDETDEYSDGQEKKMTTFQKVASALRGDRPDRDAQDQDVPENAGTTGQTLGGPDDLTAPNGTVPDPSDAAVDPSGMATGQTSQDTYASGPGTQETFARDAGTQDTAGQDTAGQDTGAFGGKDPDGTDPSGAGATRGDYWDVPDTRGTAQDQADAVTSPDRTPMDTDADPLSRQDAADAQDVTATQPDVYDADAAPVAAPETDTASPVAATDTGTTAPVAAADASATGAGATAATPQGAATISDEPVTQTSEDVTAGGPGRHAASAQELHPGEAAGLHPGEAAGSLDDLGDLAYGKLIPDAADFTAQWQEVQLKFVDDPHASVTEAAAIVEQVTTKMEAAIQERQRAIAERQRAIQEQQRSLRGRWGEGAEADTETLRATLRMYKAFLDQLVGPRV